MVDCCAMPKNYEIVTVSFSESQTHRLCYQELRGSAQEAGSSQEAGPQRLKPRWSQENPIDVKLCPFIGGGWIFKDF